MKKAISTFLFALISILIFAQNENPYKQFGYEAPIMEQKKEQIEQLQVFTIINSDNESEVGKLTLDIKNSRIAFYSRGGDLLEVDSLSKTSIARWLTTDPVGQHASPYLGMGNNPISYIDPDGRFDTKLGAWFYKVFNGGGDIRYANDKREWFVENKVDYTGSGAGIAIKRSFTWNDGSGSLGEYAWNTPTARFMFPDFLNVGAGFNGIAGTGATTNFDMNWVLRGPEASWRPIITSTIAVGGGFSVDATVNLGGTNYLGAVKDIRRSMLRTDIRMGEAGYWGSFGIAAGGKIGVEGSYTPTATGYGLVGRQVTLGAGLPLGPVPINGAGGASNTFILHDSYH